MKAGDVYKTKNWGEVEVVEYVSAKEVIIKFRDTGNIYTRRSLDVKRGNVRDVVAMKDGLSKIVSLNKGVNALDIGSRWTTNYFGDCTVIEYHGNRDVLIEFCDTGNRYNVQKNALINGLVQDRLVVAAERELERKRKQQHIDFAKQIEREKSEAVERERLLKIQEKENLKKQKEQLVLEKEQHELAELFSKDYFSKIFGKYKVTGVVCKGKFEITFEKTGYKATYRKNSIIAGLVRDKIQCSNEDYIIKTKEKAAKSYQDNRESRLQQAKDWQKNNPEKTRLRNRNRRARRVGAVGTYTQVDLDLILQEQGCKCAGCSCDLDDSKHLDHFVPLVLGGTNYPNNMQWLCQFCNNSKAGKNPMLWLVQIMTQDYQERRAAALSY